MNFIAKLFLLLFVFIYTSYANDLHKVSLQLHWKYQYEFAGFIVAKEKGYYEELGLDVELKEISFGDDRYEMFENKTSEFFILSSEVIGKQLNGLPAVLVASYFQRVPLAFVTKPDIYFPVDLKNKKVMSTINKKDNIIFENMLYSANLQRSDIKHQAHTFNLEDFISGKVDAMQIYIINELYELEKRKIPYNIIDVNNYGIEFNGIIVTTHKEYANKNPQIVQKFKEASTKGWQYAIEHKEEVVELILEKYNTQNKSKEALMYEATRSENVILPNVYPLGSLSENKIQQVIDMYERLGIVDNINIKAKELIFNTNNDNKVELTPKEKAFLIKKGALSLCASPSWMPYDAIDENGKHEGIAASLYRQFSHNLDIKFNLIQTNTWAQSLEFMQTNKCDVLSLAQKNSNRESYMNFTTSLLELNYVIATKSSELFIDDFQSVLNKQFVSIRGDAVTDYLKETYPKINLIETDSIIDALKMVSNGKAYGFIDTTFAIGHTIAKYGLYDLKITGEIGWKSHQSVATSKSSTMIHSIMQKAVDSLTSNQKNVLINKSLPIKYEKGIDYTLVRQVLVVSILLLGLFLYWNRKIAAANKIIDMKNKELECLATTDNLTKLFNRNRLDEILVSESNRSNRFKHTFGIILIDVDYFKRINDTHGHQMGDKVLQEFAQILKTHSRKTDTVGRWGGEEFLIVCSQTNMEGMLTFAEHLRKEIASYSFCFGEHQTASFGLAMYQKEESIDSLIKRADDALYNAKNNGRNRIEFL